MERISVDEIMADEFKRQGVPCCVKCGTPCLLLFVGDACDHELDQAQVDAWHKRNQEKV